MERVAVIDADLFTGFCTVQAPGGIEMPAVKYLGRPPRTGQLGWRDEVDAGVFVFWPEGAAGSAEMLIPFTTVPGAGASNTLLPYANGGTEILMPRDGSITFRTVRMALARTAGTLTVEFVNSNTGQYAALDVNINASNTLQKRDTYDLGTHTFLEGERLSARYDSSAGFTPVGLGQAINVALGVILE